MTDQQRKTDIYDEAIEYLTDNEDAIPLAWNDPLHEYGGCLFLTTSKSGGASSRCGCLTQIRAGAGSHELPQDMLDAIRNDSRIPDSVGCIGHENLHVFAEWQRKIDLVLKRVVMESGTTYRVIAADEN